MPPTRFRTLTCSGVSVGSQFSWDPTGIEIAYQAGVRSPSALEATGAHTSATSRTVMCVFLGLQLCVSNASDVASKCVSRASVLDQQLLVERVDLLLRPTQQSPSRVPMSCDSLIVPLMPRAAVVARPSVDTLTALRPQHGTKQRRPERNGGLKRLRLGLLRLFGRRPARRDGPALELRPPLARISCAVSRSLRLESPVRSVARES